jgi:hypothetical protein
VRYWDRRLGGRSRGGFALRSAGVIFRMTTEPSSTWRSNSARLFSRLASCTRCVGDGCPFDFFCEGVFSSAIGRAYRERATLATAAQLGGAALVSSSASFIPSATAPICSRRSRTSEASWRCVAPSLAALTDRSWPLMFPSSTAMRSISV